MTTEIIGKYDCIELLGQGAHGTVFLAYDPVLERQIALKALRNASDYQFDPEAALNEAKAQARLTHPHIATLHDVFEDDGQIYMAMEYVPGPTLTQFIDGAPQSFETALPIMAALADAMAYAHSMGLIHSDLKPSNILIDAAGSPKIIDFGLARLYEPGSALQTLTSSRPQTSGLEGTIAYLAPEIIDGKDHNTQSDIFALGLVFYEIMTGQRAFDGNTAAAVISQILQDDPGDMTRHAADIPQALQSLILRMLDRSPLKRPGSALDVSVQLRQIKDLSLGDKVSTALYLARRRSGFAIRRIGGLKTIAAGFVIIVLGAFAVGLPEIIPPSLSSKMSAGLSQVEDFRQEGLLTEAQQTFQSIITADTSHAGAHAGLSLAIMREYTSQSPDPALLQRASVLAETAYDLDPLLGLSVIARAWSEEFNGNFEAALALYDKADALDPDNILALEGRGRTYSKQGRLDAAETHYESAILLHPDFSIFHTELGIVRSRGGNHAGAESAFRAALALSPDDPKLYASLGHSLHLQDRTPDAIRAVQDGLEVAKDPLLHNNLGTYLFFQGRYGAAADAFQQVLQTPGTSLDYFYWANFADACRWTPGRESEAVDAYQVAIRLVTEKLEIYPDHPVLLSRLSLYHAKLGDTDRALELLQNIDITSDADIGLLYRIASSYEISGQHDTALKILGQAIDAYYPLSEIENDPEFRNLRGTQAYQQMITKKDPI